MANQTFDATMESRPIRDIAYEQLKHAIITGEIPAGSRIVETVYAEQLHISRTPLREALRNSFLLAVVQIGPNLLMLAFHVVLYCVVMYYFPMSTPYLALCVFGTVNLFATYTAWSGIRKYILTQSDFPEE